MVRMSFWNCDGSVAAMCGNAALCSTRLAERLGMAPGEGMTLVTGAGNFRTRCTPEPWQAALNLPPVAVPVDLVQVPLHPGELRLHLGTVGVPHAVLEVGDIEAIDLEGRGRELRFHPAMGPAGANVNFIGPIRSGEPTAIRTYERGVEAETLACGTGTVAAALALAGQGRLQLPASFKTRSGRHLEVNARLIGGARRRPLARRRRTAGLYRRAGLVRWRAMEWRKWLGVARLAAVGAMEGREFSRLIHSYSHYVLNITYIIRHSTVATRRPTTAAH